MICMVVFFFFFQAEDGIRDPLWSRGLGDVYRDRLGVGTRAKRALGRVEVVGACWLPFAFSTGAVLPLSLIPI